MKGIQGRLFVILYLLSIIVLPQGWLVSAQSFDYYCNVYCSFEKTTECLTATMDSELYLEIKAPVYNQHLDIEDLFSYKIRTTMTPTGVIGVAKETGNDTGMFESSIILSYDRSRDGFGTSPAMILTNRSGDILTIEMDLDNDNNYETIKTITVEYNIQKNLMHDAWIFEWDSILPMLLVGAIMALFPKSVYMRILKVMPYLGKMPKIKEYFDFEKGEKFLEANKRGLEDFGYYWWMLLSDILSGCVFFIIKTFIKMEEVPAEYANAGLSFNFIFMKNTASTLYGLIGFAISFTFIGLARLMLFRSQPTAKNKFGPKNSQNHSSFQPSNRPPNRSSFRPPNRKF